MKTLFTPLTKYIKKHPKVDLLGLVASIVVFATIALVNAPRAAIWFDEAFSAYLMNFSLWEIAKFTASDVHPPLYYWVLKIWTELFGTTELAFRSLSILFGIGVIIAAFYLARKFFGRQVAWLSLLFLSLSPMLIRYSDEARMYTMATLIVFAATHLMVKAIETKQKKYWIWYGVFVSLGMWTHYFTAFAWLAHWAWRATQTWRKGDKFKVFWKKFFTKEWVIAYSVAVGLYLPWLPFMAFQLGVVQGSGFWIGPVGVDTPTNYMTNYFYYLEHGATQSWFALLMLAVIAVTIIVLPRAYKSLKGDEKKWFLLLASMTWVPPVLLFLASLPPLRSSFVERYMVPALVALSIFMAVVLLKGLKDAKPFWRALPIIAIAGMMVFGITNVYKYGNYNKNTNTHILTREVVKAAQEASPVGTPIVAASPWIFYEAAPYSTEEYPVYFIDENTRYDFGSLEMLKQSDLHKIKDLDAFEKEHPVIWYLGGSSEGDIAPYDDSWVKIQTVGAYDDITGKTVYKATEYRVSEE